MMIELLLATQILTTPCVTIAYRHKDSTPSKYDGVTVDFIMREYAKRGKCVEAVYIMKDKTTAHMNKFFTVLTKGK